jgi:hypothetical protein
MGRIKLVTVIAFLPLVGFLLLSKQAKWNISTSLHVLSLAPPLTMGDATSGQKFKMQRVRSYISKTSNDHARSTLAPLLDENGQVFPICEKWAVITSINPPTRSVSRLAAMSDVCVCVVADIKSPATYGLENVVYLTPSIQVSFDAI